jgi:hypothetical protein
MRGRLQTARAGTLRDLPFVFNSLPTRQNIRIWMASVLIRIEPTPVQGGGYTRTGADQG